MEKVNKVHFYIVRNEGNIELWLGKPTLSEFKDYWFPTSYSTCLAINEELSIFGLNPNNYESLKFGDKPLEVFINCDNL